MPRKKKLYDYSIVVDQCARMAYARATDVKDLKLKPGQWVTVTSATCGAKHVANVLNYDPDFEYWFFLVEYETDYVERARS